MSWTTSSRTPVGLWGSLLLLVATALSAQAFAHSGGASYVEINRSAVATIARVDLPLPELAAELDLDADHDGALRWGEVLDAAPRIASLMQSRLRLNSADRHCSAATATPLQLALRNTGRHLRVELRFDCGGLPPTAIDAGQWLRDLPTHGIYVSDVAAPQHVTVLAGSLAQLQFTDPTKAASGATEAASMLRFVELGAEHLLSGYDHLAFLALLLLGALGATAPERDLRAVFVNAAKVVTAFTAAHSITLALAASGVVRLPVALVEATIAGSIVLTAALLLVSTLRQSRGGHSGWPLAFGFGLVHGLGFANVLAELLSGAHLARSLLSFNLGIEFAQLALVLAALPLLWWLGRRPQFARIAIPALASGIGALSTIWLAERLP